MGVKVLIVCAVFTVIFALLPVNYSGTEGCETAQNGISSCVCPGVTDVNGELPVTTGCTSGYSELQIAGLLRHGTAFIHNIYQDGYEYDRRDMLRNALIAVVPAALTGLVFYTRAKGHA
jgi:hypothetical protein